MSPTPSHSPSVAILPWGDTVEDWLAPLGLSLDRFSGQMTHGSWIFGFICALRKAGVRTVIVCVSSAVTVPQRFEQTPMGATVWALPEPRLASVARRLMRRRPRAAGRLLNAVLVRLRPYLSTPPRALIAVLREERCDAVLCQEYEYARFEFAVPIGRLLRTPVFATFQGGYRPPNRFRLPGRRLAIPRAAGFVVGPAAEAERLHASYRIPRERIARISNPVDTNYWQAIDKSRARERLGIGADTAVVAWHGRVDIDIKGLDLLLEAWQQVADGESGRKLCLLGSGPDAGSLDAMIQRLNPRTVSWRNEFVTDADEVRLFLSAADVYVISSRTEASPVAALEAMSCGLPVVATTTARASDFLRLDEDRVAGLEVPPEPAAIADALRKLLEDAELCERTSAWAREQVVSRFDTKLLGRQLADFMVGRTSGTARRRGDPVRRSSSAEEAS